MSVIGVGDVIKICELAGRGTLDGDVFASQDSTNLSLVSNSIP